MMAAASLTYLCEGTLPVTAVALSGYRPQGPFSAGKQVATEIVAVVFPQQNAFAIIRI